MKNDAPTAVHRFLLPIGQKVKVEMPKGAFILEATASEKGLNVFAMVDPDPMHSKQDRFFLVVATGVAIPYGASMIHLKSVTEPGKGSLHFFEVPALVAKKIGGFVGSNTPQK